MRDFKAMNTHSAWIIIQDAISTQWNQGFLKEQKSDSRSEVEIHKTNLKFFHTELQNGPVLASFYCCDKIFEEISFKE